METLVLGIVPARESSVKQQEESDQLVAAAAESIPILSGRRHGMGQRLPRLRAGVKTYILDSAEITRRPCPSSPPRIEKLSYEASSDTPLP
jgi:hypothetical protein